MSDKPTFSPAPATEAMAETLRGENRAAATAIATMLECMDTLAQEVRWQSNKLLEVEAQTIKTNGRVTKLEATNDRRSNFVLGVKWVMGGVTAVFVLVLPMISDRVSYLMHLDDEYIFKVRVTGKK